MKKTMLKTAVAALAAATVSSAMADRTYDQPGTTTFTSAETVGSAQVSLFCPV